MANFSTNQFKAGLKLMIDGEPCNILENELVKPGKGQAFSRVKIRKLISNKVLEKTFKSGESCEGADVMETELAYLYADGEFWHFMNNETFEQIAADEKAVADCVKWLKEGSKREVDAIMERPCRSTLSAVTVGTGDGVDVLTEPTDVAQECCDYGTRRFGLSSEQKCASSGRALTKT